MFERFFKRNRPPVRPLPALRLRGGIEAPVYAVARAGAWREWQRRRAAAERTGQWPLILGTEMPAEFAEDFDGEPSIVLARARAWDGETWMRDRSRAHKEREGLLDFDFDPDSLKARTDRPARFTLIEGLRGAAAPVTYFADIPCSNGWEVPALLPFGGWNDCPPDEVHCALLEKWNQLYQADVVGMSTDVIELYLPKPIHEPKVAKQVAQQMFAYASDIVVQGTETVQALARELIGARSWFFWWD